MILRDCWNIVMSFPSKSKATNEGLNDVAVAIEMLAGEKTIKTQQN